MELAYLYFDGTYQISNSGEKKSLYIELTRALLLQGIPVASLGWQRPLALDKIKEKLSKSPGSSLFIDPELIGIYTADSSESTYTSNPQLILSNAKDLVRFCTDIELFFLLKNRYNTAERLADYLPEGRSFEIMDKLSVDDYLAQVNTREQNEQTLSRILEAIK